MSDPLALGVDSLRNLGYFVAFLTLLASTSGLLKQIGDRRLNARIEALLENQPSLSSEWEEPSMAAPVGHRLQGTGTFDLDALDPEAPWFGEVRLTHVNAAPRS